MQNKNIVLKSKDRVLIGLVDIGVTPAIACGIIFAQLSLYGMSTFVPTPG